MDTFNDLVNESNGGKLNSKLPPKENRILVDVIQEFGIEEYAVDHKGDFNDFSSADFKFAWWDKTDVDTLERVEDKVRYEGMTVIASGTAPMKDEAYILFDV